MASELQDSPEYFETPRSPRLPNSPYTPSTPEQEVHFSGEEEGHWSQSEIVELGSSSDDSPPKKTLISHYFKETQSLTRSSQFPNCLRRYNPTPVKSTCGPEQSMQRRPTGASESSTVPSTGKERSTVYKSYTFAQKLEVLAYVKANSQSNAAEHFGIPRTTISSWKGLDQAPKASAKNKKGQHLSKVFGRCLSYPQNVDQDIVCWILQRRDLQLPVQRQDICRYAKTVILQHNPSFKASAGWLEKFMTRHSLCLRRATSIQQKLPAQLQKKLETFMHELIAVRSLYNFDENLILNMDETPMWFDIPRNYTIARKGERQVRIRTGSDKKRISVVLTCTASGEMLKPLLIFQGKTPRTIKDVHIPSNVVVAYQKKGYMDSSMMIVWINRILKKFTREKHCLLMFDTFSAHLQDSVKEELRKCNITTAIIPGGCTSKIQPLDVSLNKPFKVMVRHQWEAYMQEKAEDSLHSDGRIPPPTKSDLIQWGLKWRLECKMSLRWKNCCRCNSNGKCKNCSCVKSGKSCRNCLPLRLSHCLNSENLSPIPLTTTNTSSLSTTVVDHYTTSSNTTFVGSSGHDYCTSVNIPPDTSSVVTSCPDYCTSVNTSPDISSVVTSCPDYCTSVNVPPDTSSVVTSYPDYCTSVNTSPNTSSAVTSCIDYYTSVNTSPNTSSVVMSISDQNTTISNTSSNSLSISSVITSHADPCIKRDKSHNTSINHVDPLPSFVPAQIPNFRWGEIDGTTMQGVINESYNEIVHWKRNLFKVPSGKAGKGFVRELTRLLNAFAEVSALEVIALKAAFVMPALLLQKPHKRSKAKEHSSHLERRLGLWNNGSIDALLKEGHTIQKQFSNINHKSSEDLPRAFAKLLMEGKVKKALNLLSDYSSGGPMCPNEEIMTKLREKHPTRQPPKPSATLTLDHEATTIHHPIIFEQIDAQLIHKTTLQMDGTAGPSGLDAGAWKRLCSSFGACSNDLCSAVAAVAKRLCTAYVDPTCISALVAGRLIALDKCPGIRPIGIGETLRRIIARAISYVLREDIKTAAGPLQLCAGQVSGCEAAIRAIKEIMDEPTNDAVLIVDASNAFNNLNRETAMRNISVLCPSLATVIINTYRSDIQMFIGDETILSQEGTTQGDPLAMAVYAIATTPLIQQLRITNTHQIWYADDASVTSKLHNLKAWWDELTLLGPDFGYRPNASKSWLVVKEEKYDEACNMFQGTDIQITMEGQRYLGSSLGSASFAESYTKTKVSNWKNELIRLCDIATSQPYAAYAAFTHGLVHRWTFLARTIEGIAHLFQPLEDIILHKFIPALTGRSGISEEERNLMALPVRLGGLGIANPVQQAPHHYQASKMITSTLTSQIQKQATTIPLVTNEVIFKATSNSSSKTRGAAAPRT